MKRFKVNINHNEVLSLRFFSNPTNFNKVQIKAKGLELPNSFN